MFRKQETIMQSRGKVAELQSHMAELRADVHLLKYPQGVIRFSWLGPVYFYADKKYYLYLPTRLCDEKIFITGYRKKDNYLQIRYEEDVECPINKCHIFLLDDKDKPILLPNCKVEFDCDFIDIPKPGEE